MESVVEISYAEDPHSAGTGRLTLELASTGAAYRAAVLLVHRTGLLKCLPVSTVFFFGRDPCCREAGCDAPAALPLNVVDPVAFYTLDEFLTTPLSPTLPDPLAQVTSTGLITRTLEDGVLPPATRPARDAKFEFAIEPWTHVDPETNAPRIRIPFG